MEKDKKQEGRSAIELAILNGIEAYNREQAKKNAGAAAKSEEKQDAKLFGKEAMEEAGLKPKRRSRAKGKGTKLPENKEEGKQPVKEQPAKQPVKEQNAVQQPKKRGEKAQAVPAPKQNAKEKAPQKEKGQRGRKKRPIKVLFFGGVGEIGKNMTAIEYGNDIIVIDAGIIFPTEEMPGIDLVFPDITYLVQNKNKIRGVFLTHGHEDHIGGVPYLMKELDPSTPVYGSKLTLALVDNKLREHRLNNVVEQTVARGGNGARRGDSLRHHLPQRRLQDRLNARCGQTHRPCGDRRVRQEGRAPLSRGVDQHRTPRLHDERKGGGDDARASLWSRPTSNAPATR